MRFYLRNFRLTKRLPERINFVSRGSTVFDSDTRTNMLNLNYYVTKYFSYATLKLEFTPEAIIKEVKMCTVQNYYDYDLYEVIKQR